MFVVLTMCAVGNLTSSRRCLGELEESYFVLAKDDPGHSSASVFFTIDPEVPEGKSQMTRTPLDGELNHSVHP